MSFSFPDSKEDALDKAEMLLDGVNAITKLVGGATAQNAAGIITIIRVVILALEQGFDGDSVTPEDIRKELNNLLGGLSGNDAAADKELADKFGE